MHEWLAIIAIAVGLPLLAIVEVFRFRTSTWGQESQSRPRWIALSVVLGPVSALLYASVSGRVLRRTVQQLRAEVGGAATGA